MNEIIGRLGIVITDIFISIPSHSSIFACEATLADSGFFKNFLYQGGVKSTVSCVFEDLKLFKISEGYDQNWCQLN